MNMQENINPIIKRLFFTFGLWQNPKSNEKEGDGGTPASVGIAASIIQGGNDKNASPALGSLSLSLSEDRWGGSIGEGNGGAASALMHDSQEPSAAPVSADPEGSALMRGSHVGEFSVGSCPAHREWRSVSFGQEIEDVVEARDTEGEVEDVLLEDLEAFSKALREEFELKVDC